MACKVQRSKRTSQQLAAGSNTDVAPVSIDIVQATPQSDLQEYSDATYRTLHPLPISEDALASCFFFNNYPCAASKNCDNIYKQIPALYYSTPAKSPLRNIVTAIGLAGLSHHTNTSGLEVAGNTWYNKVLHEINSSLGEQDLARSDQTLLVVLLLGVYEVRIK